MMKFGISMCSYAYNEQRHSNIHRSLSSMINTNLKGLEKPVLQFMYRESSFQYQPYFDLLSEKFEFTIHIESGGMEPHILYQDAGGRLINEHQDVTHLTFIPDDWIVNPEWLRELSKLIERHPSARAWSVFRSALTYYHKIIGGDGTDVLMNMHDGFGCVTRETWVEFGVGGWSGFPDLVIVTKCPGERWATSRDYIQNICPHPGIETQDCAIDFVGEQ